MNVIFANTSNADTCMKLLSEAFICDKLGIRLRNQLFLQIGPKGQNQLQVFYAVKPSWNIIIAL